MLFVIHFVCFYSKKLFHAFVYDFNFNRWFFSRSLFFSPHKISMQWRMIRSYRCLFFCSPLVKLYALHSYWPFFPNTNSLLNQAYQSIMYVEMWNFWAKRRSHFVVFCVCEKYRKICVKTTLYVSTIIMCVFHNSHTHSNESQKSHKSLFCSLSHTHTRSFELDDDKKMYKRWTMA